jgi:hypothetical protein
MAICAFWVQERTAGLDLRMSSLQDRVLFPGPSGPRPSESSSLGGLAAVLGRGCVGDAAGRRPSLAADPKAPVDTGPLASGHRALSQAFFSAFPGKTEPNA